MQYKNKKIKQLNILLVSLTALFFSSCATLPKATVEMSVLLERQITVLENNHYLIVNKYFEEKKQYAKEIIDKQWYPVFLDEFFKNEAVKEVWEEAIASSNAEARVDALKDIVQVVKEQHDAMTNSIIQPLEQARIECLTAIQNEYEKAKLMNQTITKNISSVNDVHEMRMRLLPAEIQNAENIIYQYMEKADSILDKIQNSIQVYDQNKNKIQEILKID